MKTQPFTPDETDRLAQIVATGDGSLSEFSDDVLYRAARYEGDQWRPERRTQIVAEFKRRYGIKS